MGFCGTPISGPPHFIGTCRAQGWQKLPENKYEPLKIALVTRGPVAVAVAAKGWEMYVNGIYSDCQQDVATGSGMESTWRTLPKKVGAFLGGSPK